MSANTGKTALTANGPQRTSLSEAPDPLVQARTGASRMSRATRSRRRSEVENTDYAAFAARVIRVFSPPWCRPAAVRARADSRHAMVGWTAPRSTANRHIVDTPHKRTPRASGRCPATRRGVPTTAPATARQAHVVRLAMRAGPARARGCTERVGARSSAVAVHG